jgi:hypothetical protein
MSIAILGKCCDDNQYNLTKPRIGLLIFFFTLKLCCIVQEIHVILHLYKCNITLLWLQQENLENVQ